MSKGEQVLILGASGYVGQAITMSLRRNGVKVIGYSSETLNCLYLDAFRILDRLMTPETTLVFASALTPDRGQNVETLMDNVEMASNVSRYIGSHPPSRCVYIGSDAVYGFNVNPVTETSPVAPCGYYGLAKYTGEQMLEWATWEISVPFLSLRLTGIYGPSDPHGAYGPNAFARSLAAKRTISLFGNGEEERDHLYIGDAGRIAATLIRSSATGVINLASGTSRPFGEIVETIRRIVPYDFSVETMPRAGPVTHRHYDTTRLHEAVIGVTFTPFQEGLRATLKAFGALP